MKKYLLLCAVMFCFTKLYAQDIITLRNGDQLNVKVIKVDSFYITYKKSPQADTPINVLPRRKVLVINYNDGSRRVYRQKRIKEHFLFWGINENYLQSNSTDYSLSLGSGGYNETISGQSFTFPGFQLNYISYHELSPIVSFFNGEGLIYYHNKFTNTITHTSLIYYSEYGYETDSTIANVNSLGLFFHYIVGFRFNLGYNLYLSTSIEPHIVLYDNNLSSPPYYSQINYDSVGQVSSKSSEILPSSGTAIISALNINATFGIGYRFNASTPNPLCIEFDFSPNIFNSPLYFENSGFANDNEAGINVMTFHRYTFELSLGYKF